MSNPLPLPDEWQQLVAAARKVRHRAHAPYSKYHVGAALRMKDGQIYTGCNVENASYGLTICAERAAMCSAVAAGYTEPEAICISLTGQPAPCGSCRQFLYEFNPELAVLMDDCDSDGPPECIQLKDLLPRAFHLRNPD
jgi:cytidine deaminase